MCRLDSLRNHGFNPIDFKLFGSKSFHFKVKVLTTLLIINVTFNLSNSVCNLTLHKTYSNDRKYNRNIT